MLLSRGLNCSDFRLLAENRRTQIRHLDCSFVVGVAVRWWVEFEVCGKRNCPESALLSLKTKTVLVGRWLETPSRETRN